MRVCVLDWPVSTSSRRTSVRLRMSMSSYCALVARIAWSRMPVSLCRYNVVAGFTRSSLDTHK